MAHLFLQSKNTKLLLIHLMTALLLVTSCKKPDHFPPPVSKIITLANGLANPIGLEIDRYGNVWVAQGGTGHHDGKVTLIKPSGEKYDVIINLESFITEIGEVEGPSHLLLNNGILYLLGANGKMYKADIDGYKPGQLAIEGSILATEDIGAFVLAYNFISNAHDTHPYNITMGSDGNIYIADAAANAIIKRSAKGTLSVLAEVPGIANPLPIGPPQLQSVPTGIIFDGQNFLVTTLIGFPFPQGTSIVYKITMQGAVTVYQKGFTSLTDIAPGGYEGYLLVEHGVAGAMGFASNTGKLIWANGINTKTFADALNLPVGIKQANLHTWYVTSLGDGSVLKIHY